ncbi:MAG: ribonuclease III [Sulfuricella sp.]|nr:ribonuclease III [Sulfuricella sp.]
MSPDVLSRQLGYRFNQPELLRQALTHRSCGGLNNERLEFLGDSVLNCVTATRLYNLHGKVAEGDLSRMRAHLVKESTLNDIAVILKLGDYLLLGEGELKSGGFRRPSILADGLEAIFGAIYLDGGFIEVERIINTLYEPLIKTLDPKTLGKDPKTLLQEHLQGRKVPLPQYNVIAISGEAHEQHFEVECLIPGLDIRTLGEGGSRRTAEQVAAQNALGILS